MKEKAFCFDLDGTLTKEEILPILAKEIQLFEEISALTDATIQGILPFEKSFLLRCRLLEELPLEIVNSIISNIPRFEIMEDFIKKNNNECFIVTGNLNIWIEDLIKELGCYSYSSTAVYSNNKIRVKQVMNKKDTIKEIKKSHKKVIAIGDGMGDVGMFEEADISIAFGGTHKPIQSLVTVSDYVIYEEESLCRLLNML